jgi:sugar phosphate isomerase/epimerase
MTDDDTLSELTPPSEPGLTLVTGGGSTTVGGVDVPYSSSTIVDTRAGTLATRLAARMTAVSEQLRPLGLATGFHNHQTEWKEVDGKRPMDALAAGTPKDFVLQFDVGTCMEAGADPVAWIKANPGRIKSLHLKDWAPGKDEEQKGYRVLFGEGVTPWREIITAAESVGGVEYYLMEQEGSRYAEFETAERCLATWKKLRGEV